MSFRPEVQGSPLLPRRQRGGKTPKLERRGSLTMLLEGFKDNKETINSVITKLYRKADFDLAKAQRGIIFLDGMDKIGDNANISEFAKRQVCMKFHRYIICCYLDIAFRYTNLLINYVYQIRISATQPISIFQK